MTDPATTTARRTLRRAFAVLAALFLGLTLAAPPAAASPKSEVQSQQRWITRLGLRDVWKISEGKGTTVAVLEGGVNASLNLDSHGKSFSYLVLGLPIDEA